MGEGIIVRRGTRAVLTQVFCMDENSVKKASNGKVFNMKKFCIMKMTNFDVWVITIRPHLRSGNCVQSSKILCSGHCLTGYAPKMASYENMFYMNHHRLVESVDFDIKLIPIRVHMQMLEATLCKPVLGENEARDQTPT